MKNLNLLILSVLLLLSCSPEKMPDNTIIEQPQKPQTVTPVINVSKSTISVGSPWASEIVIVRSNVQWTYECTENWISADKSDSILTVTITDNSSSSSRTASINLKQVGQTPILTTISINQSGKNAISANVASLEFTADGGTQNISITSNFDWKTVFGSNSSGPFSEGSKPSWISISPESGSSGVTNMQVVVEENKSIHDRTILLKIGQLSMAESFISIDQKGVPAKGTITASSFFILFEDGESSKKISISSDINWRVISKPSHFNVSPMNGGIGITDMLITKESGNFGGSIIIGVDSVEYFRITIMVV